MTFCWWFLLNLDTKNNKLNISGYIHTCWHKAYRNSWLLPRQWHIWQTLGSLFKTTAILIAILLPAFLQNNLFIVIKYNSCCVWLFILFLVKYCLELSPGLWPVASVRMIGGSQKVAEMKYCKKTFYSVDLSKSWKCEFLKALTSWIQNNGAK